MSSSPPGPAAQGRRIWTVTELAAEVCFLLDDALGRVWLVGEVSNLRRPASGHLYFTLKDDSAQLRAVLFRSDAERLPFDPEDGLQVLAFGELTLWEPRGDLQVRVRHLEPRGRGALQLAFEQLRARLEGEGLFDPARKRPLPEFPRAVGVVTSPHGAALRDVIRVAAGRCPCIPLVLAPARVQGSGAARELVAALARAAAWPQVDVVLLVRGGGSLEDLLAFNSEELARAVAACPVPVVAGVGHEIDVSIADLVADVRAPTPSAAAARAVPDRTALGMRLGRDARRLRTALDGVLGRGRVRFGAARDSLRRVSPRARLETRRGRLRAAERALQRAGASLLERRRARFGVLTGRLDSLSPLAVLGRGFAIVRRSADGAIVRAPDDVTPGAGLRIRLAAGELDATVDGSPRRDARPQRR